MSEIPQKLGKYEIRRELGRGAMGIVYEGWDPMIARRVAMKTVRREQLDRNEAQEILSRFQREAQAAGRLNHPNVVAVYDFGEDADGTAYIAMEYVEGKELKDYFDRQERFPLAETVRLMDELLAAIGHAHSQGIVHRDIKPANIFVLENGHIKVGDFGIARIESSSLTQAGSVLGTPAYMSPEQFMGQRVDNRSDIFSAGVILYQFLSGEKPFSGQLTTIMHKVLKEDPIAPSELNVQIPPSFDAIVRKAMAKRPDDRYQSAQEFATALQAALAQRAPASLEATLVGAPPAADPTVVYTPTAKQPDPTVVTPASVIPVAAPPAAASATVAPPAPPATPAAMPPTLGNLIQGQPPQNAPVGAAQPPAPPVERSRFLPIAAAVGAVLVIGAGAATLYLKSTRPAPAPETSPAATSAPAGAVSAPSAPAASNSETSPRMLTIAAVAYADPSDPRFAANPAAIRTALREETRRELVEKAIALYVQPTSLNQNYAMLRDRLLARSSDFIDTVIAEEAPQTGKDGLVSMSAKATVRVRDVQKSLNQMSHEERVEFIRNNGDPKISVAITTAAMDGPPPARSQVAENVLKEKIQSFGFRTWSDDGPADQKPDFAVVGEVKFKKIQARTPTSGLPVDIFAIESWTIKCVDKKLGEEIYFDINIPQKVTWFSEAQALSDVGKLIGEKFSKGFFLQNYHFVGQKVRLNLSGLPDDQFGKRLGAELSGLRQVLAVTPVRADVIDVDLSGAQPNLADLVTAGIATPLNRKFGRACFQVGGTSGNEVRVEFSPECKDMAIAARLETAPAAALFDAPPSKRQAIVKNPDVLKKLEI